MKYTVKSSDQAAVLTEADIDALDMVQVEPSRYHVRDQHRNYDIRVLSIHDKIVELAIDGVSYSYEVSDELQDLINQMGLTAFANTKMDTVTSPMPGLVLDIKVTSGDHVKEGDALLILEAMKMENVIKASGEGVVKHVTVSGGQAVDKGQVLIEME